MAELFWVTIGGGRGGAAGFVGTAAAGAERLNAEFRFDEAVGEDTLVGGGTGVGGTGDANPSKSSSANESRDTDAFGFDETVDG